MKETLITFQVAKLAKEKRFDEKCTHSYKEVTPIELYQHQDKKYNNSFIKSWVNSTRKNSDMLQAKESRYSAPTQSLLQRWLREVHNIIVYVTPFKDIGDDINDPIRFKVFTTKTTNSMEYKTYEEALEAGLQEALKLIK